MPDSGNNEEEAELPHLLEMVQTEPESNFEDAKKKTKDLLLSIIGSIDDTNTRHVDALRHLYKGGNALKHTFESMKATTNVVNIEPVIQANNKNIYLQRRFLSTTKRRKKGNVRFATNDHFIVLGNSLKVNKKENEVQGKRSKFDARFLYFTDATLSKTFKASCGPI